MVQAIINISEDANMILNVIKAKYGLKDKSEAITTMAEEYKNKLLEPELKPEFIEKMTKIAKQKSIKVNNFAKRYGL
ncbi:MAG: antitoxin [Candidatus Diapherotrites archaeon CG08_land_8_20_14_0_20_30_16]|nr:MAG: antitoxin [Candidatus Diapherotrites archaeon CG08_land_8_20_14_0_20_30_16]